MFEYHFLSERDILTPKAYMVYNITNCWWIIHPEHGLAFWKKGYAHPQCNTNKSIAEHLKPNWGEVKFFERVLAPLDIRDYME